MSNNFVRRNLKKRSRDRPVERKKRRDDDEPNFKRQAKAKASSNVTEDALQAGMSWVAKSTQANQVAVFRDTSLAEYDQTLSRSSSSNAPRGLAIPASSISIEPEGYDFRKCEGEARSLAENAAPKCFGHQMPSKIMTVAKAGNNRGRKFYCCTFPYEERCDFFMWVEDNPALLQYCQITTNTSQPISFLDAVTAAYRKKILEMTKEELTFECHKFNSRKLTTNNSSLAKPVVKSTGTKVEVILRLEEAARWWIALHYRDFHHMPQPLPALDKGSDGMELDDEDADEEADGDEDDGMISLSDSDDDEADAPAQHSPALLANTTAATVRTGSHLSHHLHRIDNIVQRVFGFTSLRPAQRQVIERVLTHQSTLAIMPTGYGKSLCYLLPGLLTQRGLVIVISPLIALMTDQLAKVPPELPAATLTNTLTTQACGILCNQLLSGALRLLFVSPERFCSGPFHRLLMQFCSLGGKVQLVCIDEAHCLSHWSFNFRPAFLRIGRILQTIVQPQSVLALTATASLRVRHDIMSTLGIDQVTGLMMTTQPRTNLKLKTELYEDENDRFTRVYDLLKLLQTSAGKGLTIIYVWRRHDAECLGQLLTAKDIEVAFYHGGMDSNQRETVQRQFEKGKLKVIVATVAFGMGVDNQLVTRVIHYNLPKSIESYVQETGRAGRNTEAEDAEGLLLYGKQDAIEQHSLGHSSVLSELQILAFLYILINRQQPQHDSNDSSVEYELMEKILDLDEAKTDTILSLLEREGLLTINGTHNNCMEIRWRLSQEKIGVMVEKDEFMKKLVQASTTIANALNEEDDELDLRTKHNQAAVKLSILQLSSMASMTIEQVIRTLYSYQHRGLFILKASLPCASVTMISHMWLTFTHAIPAPNTTQLGTKSLLLQAPSVARKLHKLMNDHVQCNARRVECMWQVAMTLEKIELDRPGLTSNEMIQQFLAHEMEANDEDTSANRNYDAGGELAALLAMKATVPPLHRSLVSSATDDSSSSSSSVQRLKADAIAAIRVIVREPELVRLVDNIVGLTIRQLTSLLSEQRKPLIVGISAAKAACLALYAVKLLHGLPSSLLIASYWSTGLFAEEWGKYREIAFEELLSTAMSTIIK